MSGTGVDPALSGSGLHGAGAGGGAGAGAASGGNSGLPGTIDWSKVTKEDKLCRAAYETHATSDTTSLIRLLSVDFTDIGLLRAMPPLPIVDEDGGDWGEDEYEGLSALQSLALERAKADAKAARENEAKLMEEQAAAEEAARLAEAQKNDPDAVDRPPEPPHYPPLFEFLDTEDKRALKAVSYGLSTWTKRRMVKVTVRRVNKRRARRLNVFVELREMRGLELGARGVRSLALGVAELPVLMSLNLAGNMGTNDGILSLAGALPNCPWLRHLNLSRNDFDDDGAVPLAMATAKCRQLMLVDLSRNRIGDDGCIAFAEWMIPKCRKLARLNLYRNGIGDAGAIALCKALPQTTSLTSLDVRHNTMQAVGCEKLSGAVPFCTVRTTLKHMEIEVAMREYQALGVKYGIQPDDDDALAATADSRRSLGFTLPT